MDRAKLRIFQTLGFLESMNHPVNYRHIRQDSDDPQYRSHPVEQCPDDNQHNPFRTFQKAHFALRDRAFRPRARV